MRVIRLIAVAGLALAVAGPAAAHGPVVESQAPGWTLTPIVTLPLALTALMFGLGWARLSRRSAAAGLRRRQLALFLSGFGILALALVSPLHEAGERSFTAHMIEHEILMLIAAPLLVLADPLPVMLWALPLGGRRALAAVGRSAAARSAWRWLTLPAVATLLQAAALWIWHMPALFDRALSDDGWHVAQHLSFLVSALLFWSAVMPGRGGNPLLAAFCLFATSVVSGALGALMAFSDSPWYAGYTALGLAPYGLTPAEDQQLAGLLMWIPGGAVHGLAALAVVGVFLRQHDRRRTEAPHAAR